MTFFSAHQQIPIPFIYFDCLTIILDNKTTIQSFKEMKGHVYDAKEIKTVYYPVCCQMISPVK